MPKNQLLHSEAKIQQEIVKWYRNQYCLKHHNPRSLIFHVPNQGQHHLVAIGVLGGVSDLIINHKGTWHCIEVKEPNKGKQSPAQTEFESRVKGLETTYDIVFSLESFKGIVNLWS